MKYPLSLAVVLMTVPVLADETRELDAHVHGTGTLNIAFEGETVAMEFRAPGADIVGFEYEASTAEDRAAIDGAVARLAQPLDLFVLPAAAECSVKQASAALESEDDHDEHGGHEEHAEGEEHHDHDHDHDHAETADADESHTEFHADYILSCANPGAIATIEFAYFDAFTNALELEVQIVNAAGARAFEVVRSQPVLDLKGLF